MIKKSVEAEITDMVKDLANKVFESYGVTLNSAEIKWVTRNTVLGIEDAFVTECKITITSGGNIFRPHIQENDK